MDRVAESDLEVGREWCDGGCEFDVPPIQSPGVIVGARLAAVGAESWCGDGLLDAMVELHVKLLYPGTQFPGVANAFVACARGIDFLLVVATNEMLTVVYSVTCWCCVVSLGP